MSVAEVIWSLESLLRDFRLRCVVQMSSGKSLHVFLKGSHLRRILLCHVRACCPCPQECIDPWLETKAVCAYCKVKVEARRSCCNRGLRSASDRLGINLVAPTTIHFSSSRRTYTNQDVSDVQASFNNSKDRNSRPGGGGGTGGGWKKASVGTGVGGWLQTLLFCTVSALLVYLFCDGTNGARLCALYFVLLFMENRQQHRRNTP